MRRLALVLATLAVLGGLAATPARAHDSTTILGGCTGYVTTAAYQTAAGNLYESRRNLCHGLYAIGVGYGTVEAVERARCYRNNAAYAGCRWEGYTDQQSFGAGGWVGRTHDYWCDTCGGAYISDSGRHYGPHVDFPDNTQLRIIGNNRRVRFKLADGTTLLIGESSRTSGPVTCCNW